MNTSVTTAILFNLLLRSLIPQGYIFYIVFHQFSEKPFSPQFLCWFQTIFKQISGFRSLSVLKAHFMQFKRTFVVFVVCSILMNPNFSVCSFTSYYPSHTLNFKNISTNCLTKKIKFDINNNSNIFIKLNLIFFSKINN